MNSRFIASTVAFTLLATSAMAQHEPTVKNVIPFKAEGFPISEVILQGDSPFKHAQDFDGKWLLSLNPDRFLARFRINAGLEPKAEGYYGWEGGGCSGHCFGHYLSAISRFWCNTGDPRFKEKLDYCIDELALCQEARGTGYVGGMPEEDRIWSEVSAGDIRYVGGGLNGGWVPMYTLHKVHAGLVDAYRFGGNEKAKDIFIKLVQWEIGEFDHLTTDQFQALLESESGGLNEVIAETYAYTGNEAALTLAEKFYHKAVVDPLSEGIDDLEGLHSNTQIPKVIGAARIYELTGEAKQARIAEFFWDAMVHDHTYVNGGNSNHEHLGKPGKLNDQLSESTTETCNTYNMLKLTRHLYEWSADASKMDYFERALYNHILASQNPETGMVSYFVPLATATYKTFCQPETDFFCCTGTGMENHSKYAESIFFKSTTDGGLFLNLFIPSQLSWKEKGLKVNMETLFPYSNKVKLTFEGKSSRFPLHIRFPEWAHSAIKVTINGKTRSYERPEDSYITIKGKWKQGSVVEIELPMDIHTVAMPDNPDRLGVFYGPILLCGDLGKDYPTESMIPRFVGEPSGVPASISPIEGKPLHFEANTTLDKPVELVPFFEMHDRYHQVYFDVLDEALWAEKKAAIIAKEEALKELEARTIDYVYCGEQQSEIDHNLEQKGSETGYALGYHFRHGVNAEFSYLVKVDPSNPVELYMKYWGSDAGNRVFDVLVDGELLATIALQAQHPNEFFDWKVDLPESMTAGKDTVRIQFSAHPGNYAGGVFGLRIAKK